MKRTIPPCARWSNLLSTNFRCGRFKSRAAFSYVDRIAAAVRAEDDVLYLIGEPDCWGADDSSVLHSLFQKKHTTRLAALSLILCRATKVASAATPSARVFGGSAQSM